jgi:MtN3 and saliva related transmembrane protein
MFKIEGLMLYYLLCEKEVRGPFMNVILSSIAAVLTTISFFPQAIKAMKGYTKSISLGMYIIFVIGITCWLVYGIASKNYAITVANSFGFVLASIILFNKVKNVIKGVD